MDGGVYERGTIAAGPDEGALMTRKSRILNRAVAVALAVLATSATTAAQAQAGEWTSQGKNYATTVSGGQTVAFEFKVGPYTATCTTVAFEGQLKAKEFTYTADPSFQKCKTTTALGTWAVLFTINECDFGLTAPALASGELKINCPQTLLELDVYSNSSGEGAPVCVYKFFPQGPLPGITWSNETVLGVNRVKGVFSGVKPKYLVTGSEFLCGKEGSAEIKGTTTLVGQFGKNPEGVDIG
jgi:hypothetical protein